MACKLIPLNKSGVIGEYISKNEPWPGNIPIQMKEFIAYPKTDEKGIAPKDRGSSANQVKNPPNDTHQQRI